MAKLKFTSEVLSALKVYTYAISNAQKIVVRNTKVSREH